MGIIKELRQLGINLLEMVYPSGIYCISCGAPMDSRFPYSLCYGCVRKLKWTITEACVKCGRPLKREKINGQCEDCSAGKHFFDKGISCVMYGDREKHIIYDFKYGKKAYYGEKLGEIMAEKVASEPSLRWDMVIPVPMYKEKEKDRGYNQAALLGRYMAEHLGTAFIKNALIRIVDTPPMSSLSIEERERNVRNVFIVNNKYVNMIKGKSILLVDDIFTTGNTMDECARVLKESDAGEVFAVAFAAVGEGLHLQV